MFDDNFINFKFVLYFQKINYDLYCCLTSNELSNLFTMASFNKCFKMMIYIHRFCSVADFVGFDLILEAFWEDFGTLET